jgi:hypothetical protein
MRHLLTTFAAAALVVGLGFAIAPAHAAPLPQLNCPSNQASPVEKIGYYGYRRYGYYPRHRYYWRHRYYRPYYGYGYSAVSLWLLEPALLSALVVVFCPGPVGLPPVLIAVSRRTSINKR